MPGTPSTIKQSIFREGRRLAGSEMPLIDVVDLRAETNSYENSTSLVKSFTICNVSMTVAATAE
jgi:hypothetical protein